MQKATLHNIQVVPIPLSCELVCPLLLLDFIPLPAQYSLLEYLLGSPEASDLSPISNFFVHIPDSQLMLPLFFHVPALQQKAKIY